MNNTLPSARIRSLQEPSLSPEKVSTLFMRKALSPAAALTAPLSRLATDGTFNHGKSETHLVR